ncbi:MAG TPA: DUF2231 domain-containing protein [Mycobacteriales bacterium]|jgi:hypothetical protein|nr:DUF2231 domain-containing protein [Mycobacteriales bacterium]
MFDKIGDVPSHPLVIHLPVVLLPLAAFTVLLYIAAPRWRVWSRWWLAGFAVVGCGGAWLATQTGERLRDSLHGVDVERHEGFGENTFRWSIALVVVAAACIAVDEFRTRSSGGTADIADPAASGLARLFRARYTAWVLYALLIAVAAVVVAYVVAAGHSGAHLVWGNSGDST